MDLRQEQMRLQYKTGDELSELDRMSIMYDAEHDRLLFGERSISLKGYASLFAKSRCDHIEPEGELAERGLFLIFEQILAEKGSVVWVDLGCANGIALRQGKRHFEATGMGIENLVTIGYDVLPFDRFEYDFKKSQFPDNYHEDDWETQYEPDFAMADIMDVVFPEAPDIVTCVGVMQWSRDPLRIFANAARQLPEGAYFGISGMDCVQKKNGWDPFSNPVIDAAIGTVPGFETIKLREEHPPHLLGLRRTAEEVPDFTFGFANPRPIHPPEDHNPKKTQRNFVTYYSHQ